MFDLMIIGGGPAGYVAAERAGSKGLKVVLFEKKTIGGVCLNEGCIPTKALLYSAKMYEHAVEGDKFGVLADNVSFDYGKMVARKNKLVRKLVGGVKMKMKSNKVEVVEGEAVLESRSDEGVVLTCNGEKYTGKNVLICTGSEASVPPIPGLKEAADVILTNREILEMKERPESLVVIGGGVIGMEFACFYQGLGTKVTVVEMLPEILGGLDGEVSAMVRDYFAKKGIDFHMQAKVTKVDGNKVTFEKDGKSETVEGEKILLSVGRRPVTKGVGLENLNIELDRGGIKVDERMRTNVDNVFAAGDVTGYSLLAHTASREAEVVVNNITGGDDVMSYKAIPGVVYISPEVAGVGETEETAKEKGLAYKTAKLPMTYAGRFMIENERFSGFCKVLIGEKYGEILGIHMFGNPSSEMVYGACLAIEQEMTLEEMKKVVFPHPTVSEIFKEVIFSEFK